MTQADTLDVRRIDPSSIRPDPDNPRAKLRDLDELAASVALHGVLEPITVRPNPSSNGGGPTWIVVRGHRRHAAALQAKVEQIPCIVDWSEDAKSRVVHRMVENLQRDDLTAAEHAKGVQQLLDLGIAEEDVARQLSVKTDHVRRAKAISTSKVLAKAPATFEMSFDQAAAIVEFEDSPKIAKELLTTAQKEPENFDYEVLRYRQEREERRLIDGKCAQLKEQGYKILKDRPWGPTDYGTKETPLGNLRATSEAKSALTPKAHEKCPGRAAYVETDHNGNLRITEACADWKSNGHAPFGSSSSGRGASGSRAPKPPAQLTPAEKRKADKEKQERRIHLAAIKAGRAAEVARRRFVTELLGRAEAPKGTLAFAVPALLSHHLTNPKTDMFCELTGVKKPTGYGTTVVAKYVDALTEKQLPLAVLAVVAAHIEKMWEPSTWKGAWGLDRRKEYIHYLASCGYAPSLIEKVILGEAKAAEVLAEAERIKAAAKG